jgi:membrane protein implicated in regulation of membrane protease activity
MKLRTILAEFVLPLALLAALIVLAFPVGQNHTMVMTSQGIALAAFIALALWVWREYSTDEREDRHRMAVGRTAYLAGSGVLVVAIVVQSVDGAVDPWLLAALAVMVLVKVFGSVWLRLRR